MADDFTVPSGETWAIGSVTVEGFSAAGTATSVFVRFYDDSSGLPGTLDVNKQISFPGFNSGATTIDFSDEPVIFGAGTYWVSVVADDPSMSHTFIWEIRQPIVGNQAAASDSGT